MGQPAYMSAIVANRVSCFIHTISGETGILRLLLVLPQLNEDLFNGPPPSPKIALLPRMQKKEHLGKSVPSV